MKLLLALVFSLVAVAPVVANNVKEEEETKVVTEVTSDVVVQETEAVAE